MNIKNMNRRSFLAAGAVTAPHFAGITSAQAEEEKQWIINNTIRVGVVGCGPYSHVRSYGNVLLALDGRRPHKTSMRMTHIWGDDYRASFKGKIWKNGTANSWIEQRSPEFFAQHADITIVNKPDDMIGEVDAAMIMDFDTSADLSEPFLKAGMPIFINRPFAATMEDGRRILSMAAQSGTAVFTGSLVPWIFETRKLQAQIDRNKLYAFHADAVSSGFCRYASHGLEFIFALVGAGVRRARLSGWNGSHGYDPASLPPVLIELEYEKSGVEPPLRGTLLMRGHILHDWWFRGYLKGGGLVEGAIPGHDGVSADIGDDHWRLPFLGIMEHVFRTGQSPETHDDILHKLATLLAVHKSAMEEGRWVELSDVEDHRLPSVLINHWSEKI